MKINYILLVIPIAFCSLTGNAQKERSMHGKTPFGHNFSIQPSGIIIDTVKYITTKPDIIAVFETNGFICYGDGSVIIDYLKSRIAFVKGSTHDTVTQDKKKCLANYEKNYNLALQQSGRSDTIFLNKLDLTLKTYCYESDDITRDFLEDWLMKAYNKKKRAYETFLILYRKHTSKDEWYDRIQSLKGEIIYKGPGTLDKF